MSVGYDFLAFLLQQEGRDGEAARVLQSAVAKGLASEEMREKIQRAAFVVASAAEGGQVAAPAHDAAIRSRRTR